MLALSSALQSSQGRVNTRGDRQPVLQDLHGAQARSIQKMRYRIGQEHYRGIFNHQPLDEQQSDKAYEPKNVKQTQRTS